VTDDREKRQARRSQGDRDKKENIYNFAEGLMTRRSVS
jgi:hypothetical protein